SESVMGRVGRVERSTAESKVLVEVDLDGTGTVEVRTGIGFYDHMLAQLGKHGGVRPGGRARGGPGGGAAPRGEGTPAARGTGRALGRAFAEALGDKAGVVRFGSAVVPLDEVLVQAAVDLSGRPYVVHDEPLLAPMIGPVYPSSMTRHVWESFGHTARVTLHV